MPSLSSLLPWAAACVVSVSVSACSDANPAPISEARVHFEAIDVPVAVMPADGWVRAYFEKAAGVRSARQSVRAAKLSSLPRIDVTLAKRRSNGERPLLSPQVPFVLRVRLTEPDAPSLVARGTRSRRLEASEPLPSLPTSLSHSRAALEEALAAAWVRVLDKRALLEAGSGRWLEALGETPSAQDAQQDPWQAIVAYERVALATDALAARRSPQAVAPLLHLVQRGSAEQASALDQAIGRKAIVALGAIGDGSAVLPLIEAAQRQPPEHVVHVAYAVGAIGGRTAQGWLVTLASGHDDLAVRSAAHEALGTAP